MSEGGRARAWRARQARCPRPSAPRAAASPRAWPVGDLAMGRPYLPRAAKPVRTVRLAPASRRLNVRPVPRSAGIKVIPSPSNVPEGGCRAARGGSDGGGGRGLAGRRAAGRVGILTPSPALERLATGPTSSTALKAEARLRRFENRALGLHHAAEHAAKVRAKIRRVKAARVRAPGR